MFSFGQFDYCVSWCVPPGVNPVWNSLHFLGLGDSFLSYVREVFLAIISSNIFSGLFSLSSPSGIPIMQILVHLVLSQRPFKLSSLLFILFFSLFYSAAEISTILSSTSLIHSSASFILLLIPSSVFFISVIIFFNSVWLFFIFSNSLLKTSYNFLLCASILFPSS